MTSMKAKLKMKSEALALGTVPKNQRANEVAGSQQPRPDRGVSDRDLMIGLTINFSPTRKLTTREQKANPGCQTWGQLTPKGQINAIKDLLEDKVYPHIDMAETHFEFTAKGEIHSHSALIMRGEAHHDVWNLQTFRKTLNQEFKVQGKASVQMLHSFKVDDLPKWLTYIRKSDNDMPISPDYKSISEFLFLV